MIGNHMSITARGAIVTYSRLHQESRYLSTIQFFFFNSCPVLRSIARLVVICTADPIPETYWVTHKRKPHHDAKLMITITGVLAGDSRSGWNRTSSTMNTIWRDTGCIVTLYTIRGQIVHLEVLNTT